jgi:hypothetical protein
MRDQISEIVITVAEDDPLERALVDPDGRRFGTAAVEHDLGQIVGGPMVRLGDVERAIEARGYSGTGHFDIELTDEHIATSVRITKGRAAVRPSPKPSGGRFQTTRPGLAAILYGGLTPSAAVSLGLAEGKPEVVAKIEALVRMPPLSPIDAF